MCVNSKIVHLPLKSSPHSVEAQHSPFDFRNSEADRSGKLTDSPHQVIFPVLTTLERSFQGPRLLETFPLA
jgi:hypothetical protein